VVMNQTLGSVVYRNGDTTIAFQGGGVWKRTGSAGSSMVSPPEFHYRSETLTLPLIVVDGHRPLTGKIMLTSGAAPEPKYPVSGDPNRANPLTSGQVAITIHSRYYDAWGRFFEDRTGGQVTTNPAAETVTITFVAPSNRPPVSTAIASTAAQRLVIRGSGGSSFTDGYNSTKGPYNSSKSHNGTIVTKGGVNIQNGIIYGNLVSGGGVVSLKSASSKVTGNISYGGASPSIHKKATVGGWIAANGSVSAIDPVGTLIQGKVNDYRTSNDNGATDAIVGDTLNASQSSWTLTHGTYYLSDMDLHGKRLVFDNTGGDVNVVVGGDVDLTGSRVEVASNESGDVHIYMAGTRLNVGSGANVSVPGNVSSKFWVYGPPGTTTTVDDAVFNGVIYAPGTATQVGSVNVETHGQVFGAVVGGQTTLTSGGSVHFDQALQGQQPIPTNATTPILRYFHITVDHVQAADG